MSAPFCNHARARGTTCVTRLRIELEVVFCKCARFKLMSFPPSETTPRTRRLSTPPRHPTLLSHSSASSFFFFFFGGLRNFRSKAPPRGAVTLTLGGSTRTSQSPVASTQTVFVSSLPSRSHMA